MTIDSPKGAEAGPRPPCNCAPCQREAAARNAPIPYLRRQVAELVFDALEESRQSRGFLPEITKSDADAAAAAVVGLVQPEVERLTTENQRLSRTLSHVQRQRDENGERATEEFGARQELLAEVNQLLTDVGRLILAALDTYTWGGDPSIREAQLLAAEKEIKRNRATAESMAAEPWRKVRRERDEARAEVSRLREQLAAATSLVDDLLSEFTMGEKGHPGRPCVRTRWVTETAVARFHERRAGLAAPVSEAVPTTPQRIWHGTRVLVYPGPNRSHPDAEVSRNHGVGRITWLSSNIDPLKSRWGVAMEAPYNGTSEVGIYDFEVLPDRPGYGPMGNLREPSKADPLRASAPSEASMEEDPAEHNYLSTACLHEQHDYCVAPVVSREGSWSVLGPSYSAEQDASKNPAQCKFCSAQCRCGCHGARGTESPNPQITNETNTVVSSAEREGK